VTILTLQSQVAYGHVGNSAAAFALQRVGCEAVAVPTVLLSNHPGYGQSRGAPVAPSLIADMIEGLDAVGALARCEGVLTGYLPSAETGAAVLDAALRAQATGAIWLCDPVFGDEGRVYARAGVMEFLRDAAIPRADIATPNLFELETLTGLRVGDLHSARAAMAALRGRGPRAVLCTSFERETPAGALDVLALDDGGLWRARTARLDRRFDGAGDLFAALFLAAWLDTRATAPALGRRRRRARSDARRRRARTGADRRAGRDGGALARGRRGRTARLSMNGALTAPG
jgi:pyridoxine kinase